MMVKVMAIMEGSNASEFMVENQGDNDGDSDGDDNDHGDGDVHAGQ